MLRQKNIGTIANPTVDPLMKQWLKQRQDLLVLYSQLSVIKLFDSAEKEKLELFCQTLVDYVSIGHFKMFEKIAEFYQSYQPAAAGLDGELLNKILTTTDIILDFNDKYLELDNLETLSTDLSHLGENLAQRLDWEDGLIKTYLQFNA